MQCVAENNSESLLVHFLSVLAVRNLEPSPSIVFVDDLILKESN